MTQYWGGGEKGVTQDNIYKQGMHISINANTRGIKENGLLDNTMP